MLSEDWTLGACEGAIINNCRDTHVHRNELAQCRVMLNDSVIRVQRSKSTAYAWSAVAVGFCALVVWASYLSAQNDMLSDRLDKEQQARASLQDQVNAHYNHFTQEMTAYALSMHRLCKEALAPCGSLDPTCESYCTTLGF